MWLPGYPGVPCENEEGRDEIPQARMKVIAFVLAHAAAIELAIKVPVGRDRISTGECTPGANCLLRDCTSPGTMGPLYDEECHGVAASYWCEVAADGKFRARQSIEDYNYNYDPVVKYNGGGQYYDAFQYYYGCSGLYGCGNGTACTAAVGEWVTGEGTSIAACEIPDPFVPVWFEVDVGDAFPLGDTLVRSNDTRHTGRHRDNFERVGTWDDKVHSFETHCSSDKKSEPFCTPDDSKCAVGQGFGCGCRLNRDISFEDKACEGDWKPIYTGLSCDDCPSEHCLRLGEYNTFTCYRPTCEGLPPDIPYHSTNRTTLTILIVVIVRVAPSHFTSPLVSRGPHPHSLSPLRYSSSPPSLAAPSAVYSAAGAPSAAASRRRRCRSHERSSRPCRGAAVRRPRSTATSPLWPLHRPTP